MEASGCFVYNLDHLGIISHAMEWAPDLVLQWDLHLVLESDTKLDLSPYSKDCYWNRYCTVGLAAGL